MSQALQAIVLAGGLGTRLRAVIQDIPKPMAPVAGKPFLHFLLQVLSDAGFRKTMLSVGYKHETILAHFGHGFGGMELAYFVEEEPLGTGGGILGACRLLDADNILILNGDTYFGVDLAAMHAQHLRTGADLTCALKPMRDFDRYGTVDMDAEGRISAFNEKQARAEGLINGGVYWMKRSLLTDAQLPDRFSFEKLVLEGWLKEKDFRGFVSEGYFIDIGIPEDYARADVELPAVIGGEKA